MKLHHYISVVWASICLLAASMTACSDRDYPAPEGGGDGGDKLQLGFNVVLPSLPGSRASYEEGVGDYENTVNLAAKDYRILLFSYDNNTLLANFDPNNIVMIENRPSASNPTYRSYRLYAEVDKNITSYRNLKLVVLANWGDYPSLTIGQTTIDDLAGYADNAISTLAATTFEAATKFTAASGRHIPMFGVKECPNINWANFDLAWLGDLWLLRAVAKIEVKAADGYPSLESVAVTRYNKLGTCAPMRVYKETDYVTGENQYKSFDYVTLPGGKNDPADAPYAVQPGDDGKFVVYVPEYQILADPSKPTETVNDYARLAVKFKGNANTFYVDFKYYTDASASDNDALKGDFFDIKRNYFYRYTLRMSDAEPEVTVDVLPYRAVTLKPDFGLLTKDITLDKYVVKLYTDSQSETSSTDIIVAYDEHGKQIPTDDIVWSIDNNDLDQVCSLKKNDDGSCTVTPKAGKTGRDLIIASVKVKNGLTVTAECVVEVSSRHLDLDKTFLGITPLEDGEDSSMGSFNVNIVAETDAQGTISWELLNEDDLTKSDLDVDITVEVDGVAVANGAVTGAKEPVVKVKGGNKTGTAHLWIRYNGPDPKNPGQRVTYSTFCEIMVQEISLFCYPQVASVIVGQSTTFSTTIVPKFSNFIPAVKYISSNPSVATVDENGLVTGIVPGTVKIEVYNDTDFPHKISDEVTVTVKPNDLVLMRRDGVTVADYVELRCSEAIQLKAMSHGVDISKQVRWYAEPDGDNFITYKNGVVTAKSGVEGSATMVAEYTVGDEKFVAKCVFVVSKTRRVMIKAHPISVSTEAEIPMEAYIFPDSVPADQRNYKLKWTSSNASAIDFDDAANPALAVAKAPGSATLTVQVTDTHYTNMTAANKKATSSIVVRSDTNDDVQSFRLYLTDPSGKTHVINSVDAEYPGGNDGVNVGGLGYFDKIIMKPGETWTATAEFKPNTISVPSASWSKYQRYTYHGNRVNLTPEGNTCKIKAVATDNKDNRYNEVIFKFTYKNKEYTRRFCVYVYQ